MNQPIPPLGMNIFPTNTTPNAYALLIHDIAESDTPLAALIAQSLARVGIETLKCDLHRIQPVDTARITACYDWLTENRYKPQIAIGVGAGAHLQHLLEWKDCRGMVHVNPPGVQAFAQAVNYDLFTLPEIDTFSGKLRISSDTASDILTLTNQPEKFALTPQLWLGDAATLDSLQLASPTDRLHIDGNGISTSTMVIARLISNWVLSLTIGTDNNQKRVRHNTYHHAEGHMFDNEHIELQANEIIFSLPPVADAGIQILLLALVHTSMVQFDQIIKQLGWKMPWFHLSLRYDEVSAAGVENHDGTAFTASYIREIHIVQGMDEVQKNLLHHHLPDTISIGGQDIQLINQLR